MTHEQFQSKIQAIPDNELVEMANLAINKLCKTGARSFTMSIPPRINDTDILLTEVVKRLESKTPQVNLAHLRIVDITTYQPIRRELGLLSHSLEYKLNNPESKRKLITEEETYRKIREIIDLVQKIL